MYGNPQRTPGCYNNPLWLQYMKHRVDERFKTDGGDVASIFFDNVNFYDCRCPICQESFRTFTREQLGEEMDLNSSRSDVRFRFAKGLWQAESTRAFFEKVKAYIRTIQDPTPISPNFHTEGDWTSWLTWKGTSDIIFYEQGRDFPPFVSTTLGYKTGLAESGGRAVGQLLGLPERGHEGRQIADVGPVRQLAPGLAPPAAHLNLPQHSLELLAQGPPLAAGDFVQGLVQAHSGLDADH